MTAQRQRSPSVGGLQIIAALATRWGVTIDEDRRTIVWAHLFCNPLATNGVQCRYR